MNQIHVSQDEWQTINMIVGEAFINPVYSTRLLDQGSRASMLLSYTMSNRLREHLCKMECVDSLHELATQIYDTVNPTRQLSN